MSEAMNFEKLPALIVKVGDTVLIHRQRQAARPATVTKVGRKWFYVDSAERCGFSLEDGQSNSGYSFPTASTLEQAAFNARVDAAVAFLRERGIEMIWHLRRGDGWSSPGGSVALAELIKKTEKASEL